MRQRGLNARLVGGAAVLLVLIAGAFALTLVGISDERAANRDLRQSMQRIAAVNQAEKLAIDTETGLRGFLLTGDRAFLAPYDAAVAALPGAQADLRASEPAGATRRRQLTEAVIAEIESYRRDYADPLIARFATDPAAARGEVGEGKLRVDRIRATVAQLKQLEQADTAAITARSDAAADRALTFAIIGLAGCPLLILLFTGYLSRLVVVPIRRVAGAAHRIAQGDLAARVQEHGRGETLTLAHAFNTMAAAAQHDRTELKGQNAELEAHQGQLERTLDALADEQERSERYHRVVAGISSEAEVEPLARLLLRDLGELLEADAATLYVLDVAHARETYLLVAQNGFDREALPARLTPNAGLAGRALAERRTIVAEHAGGLSIPAFGGQAPIRHELHVPFHTAGSDQVAGIASFVRIGDRSFSPAQLNLLRQLVEPATAGLLRSLMFESSRHHAAVNQAVLETAQDAFIAVDADAAIVAWSPQATAMFGYAEEEALDQPVPDLLLPERHRAAYRAGHAKLLAQARGPSAAAHRFELRARHRDGHEFLIELSVAPMEIAGALRLNGFVRDITGRVSREREREARAAVSRVLAAVEGAEALVDPVLAALGEALGWQVAVFWAPDADQPDRLRRAGSWSAADVGRPEGLEEITRPRAFARGEGLPGRTWQAGEARWERVREEGGARARAALAADLHHVTVVPVGRGAQSLGVLEFWERESSPPDSELLDTLDGIAGLIVEVTERRRAEQEADRLKDELFALVSHELRTPLTSIVGYLELVLEGDAGEVSTEQRRFLGIVARNAHRLQRLVGDLHFVAQVEAGTLTLERRRAALDEIVRDGVEAARPRAEQGSVAVVADAEPVPEIEGDPDRLGQLVDNLVSNALKFTPPGGHVTVRLRRESGALVLSVADTGIGIPPDEQARLFDRFYRASTAIAQEIPGVGLGLSICQAIAEGHGGRITVDSKVGAGTTFRVVLPLRAPARAAGGEPVRTPRGA